MKQSWLRLLKKVWPCRFCEHEGCLERWSITCRLASWTFSIPDELHRYCVRHCSKNGYCLGCGEFWAGIERFDFSPLHLCPNCESEFEEPEDDDEYLIEMPEGWLP